MKKPIFIISTVVLAWIASLAHGQEASAWSDGFNLSSKKDDEYRFMFSPYTYHFGGKEGHKDVWLVGVERERSNGILAGFTFFSNSFGQPSTYIFPWGQMYRNIGWMPGMYFKWTAGLLYGYVAPYENKVPLNHNGYSPAVIPTLGIEKKDWQVQVNALGTNGFMLQINRKIN
ncbi:MAG: hypothetical protein EXR35_09260 [Limnohabitans sp.]|nr:hypothetical protein [Limnohabitans sp.]